MKKILLILLCLPIVGFGQIDQYIKECISGDCINGYGKARLNVGVYNGDFLNGIPNSKGRLVLNGGNVYIGDFKNGTANGIGVLEYTNGDRYEGQFESGKEHGRGTLSYTNGKVYEGYFLYGNRNGSGAETDVNGDRYIGSFKENLKHGKGRLISTNSIKAVRYYKGKLEKQEVLSQDSEKEKKLIGQKIKSPNGDVYFGEYVNSEKVGYGRMEYKNGDEYLGSWLNNMQNGNGVMLYENGDEYTGNWLNGKRHGDGVFVIDGKKERKCEYDGDWYNDKMHGDGIVKWHNSSLLQAEFFEGKPTGIIDYLHTGKSRSDINEIQTSDKYNYRGEINLADFVNHNIVTPKGSGIIKYGGQEYGVNINSWLSRNGPEFSLKSVDNINNYLDNTYVVCTKPKLPPKLVITNLNFIDESMDTVLNAGETGKITFILKNEGKGVACNLFPRISTNLFNNQISIESKRKIKKIKQGEEINVEVELKASLSVLNNTMKFYIDVAEANGFDLYPRTELLISTQKLVNPDVQVVDAEFYSEEGGQARIGGVISLRYIIQNLSYGTAEDVKVNISLPEDIYPADETEINIGRLKGGESKKLDFQFFANNRFIGNKINLSIDIEEKLGMFTKDTILTVALSQKLLSSRSVDFAVSQKISDENPINIKSLSSIVDKNIPINEKIDNRYALVIGNEDYKTKQTSLSSEQNVAYAVNDANIFKEYALKTLGVKKENMFVKINATAGEMNQEIKRVTELLKTLGEEGELIFYYAGHGFPDEKTKIPYLVPVDVSASDLSLAIKLDELYQEFGNTKAKRITIFLDACFTGAGRNVGLLAARGVRVKPKEGELDGNIVVFSSSSEVQSSLPYHKKRHGIFTYHLLKNLQDSEGEISYGALFDKLERDVNITSLKENSKKQEPKVNISPKVRDEWKSWKF